MADSSLIQVVFICDENFALPTGVAIASLLATRGQATRYAVHVVSSGLSADSKARLQSLAGPAATIDICEVDGREFADITSGNVHVSPAAIFKFKLPELFPELDRVLYLDGDIVVRGDLGELWATDIEDVFVAAVEDVKALKFGGKTLRERIDYPYEKYFNSGMMLVNLAAWRREGIPAKLLHYRLHGKNDFMDQDALNSVLGSAVRYVDFKFNTLATSIRYEEEPVRREKETAAVVYHYASPEKPWKQLDVDNEAPWRTAFAASPFADVELKLTPRSELDTYKRRSNALWHQLERVKQSRDAALGQVKVAVAEAQTANEAARAAAETSKALRAKAAERLKGIVWLKKRQEEQEKLLAKTKATLEETAEKLAESEKTAATRLKGIVWLKNRRAEAEGKLAAAQEKLAVTGRELASVRGRLAQTDERLTQANERLTQTNERLAKTGDRLKACEQKAAERLKGIVWLKRQKERLTMENAALQKRIDDSILVSVLIPVYNVEKYLRQTLDSVVNQGLTSIEIVAVDNCSTDGSLAILREYAARDPRMRVIALPENGGVRASRTAALEAARGKYVLFLDSDDFLEPDILAQAFAAAEAGNCDVMQFGHREFRDGDGEIYRTSLPNPKCVGADIRSNPDILRFQTKYIWDKLFRHQFLLDNDIRIPVYSYMEDHYFLFRVALRAKNFGILPVYGYRYRRQVATARSRAYGTELLDCAKAYWDIVQTARREGLFKILATSIWHNAAECYRWRALGFANYDNKELQAQIVLDWFDFFQKNFPRWQKNLHLAGIPCVLPPGQPKKVLLLGGTGALGAHLRDILAERGFEVWVTSRSPHEDTEHIHYLQLDAMVYNSFKKLMASHWDAIVDFMIYPPQTFEARLEVFLRQTDQYVSLSSARVYADAGETPLTEESPRLLDTVKDEAYLQTNEYALAKARDENILRAKGGNGNWTIIRPYITFSEERLQLGTLEKEQWLKRALAGKPIVFSKDVAGRLTTLTYGRDVALGMASVIGRKEALGETFHITSPKQIRWSEALDIYVKVLSETLGKPPKVVMTKESVQLKTPGKYQVVYDRGFNRRFDNAKIGRFVDVNSFRDPKEALESCLRAFLASDRKFRPVNEALERLHDDAARCWPLRIAAKIKRKLKAIAARSLKAKV